MKNINTILILLLGVAFYKIFQLQFKLINLKLLKRTKTTPIKIQKSNNYLPINMNTQAVDHYR